MTCDDVCRTGVLNQQYGEVQRRAEGRNRVRRRHHVLPPHSTCMLVRALFVHVLLQPQVLCGVRCLAPIQLSTRWHPHFARLRARAAAPCRSCCVHVHLYRVEPCCMHVRPQHVESVVWSSHQRNQHAMRLFTGAIADGLAVVCFLFSSLGWWHCWNATRPVRHVRRATWVRVSVRVTCDDVALASTSGTAPTLALLQLWYCANSGTASTLALQPLEENGCSASGDQVRQDEGGSGLGRGSVRDGVSSA
jgi:hypothetical protein